MQLLSVWRWLPWQASSVASRACTQVWPFEPFSMHVLGWCVVSFLSTGEVGTGASAKLVGAHPDGAGAHSTALFPVCCRCVWLVDLAPNTQTSLSFIRHASQIWCHRARTMEFKHKTRNGRAGCWCIYMSIWLPARQSCQQRAMSVCPIPPIWAMFAENLPIRARTN